MLTISSKSIHIYNVTVYQIQIIDRYITLTNIYHINGLPVFFFFIRRGLIVMIILSF